ncbi:MAG TPA: 3-deoxy-D-manno-octulosonic acid transferase [Xanthobacteraceae bacterium]
MLERSSLALQAYRLVTAVAAPLAPALVSHRLKRGKEDPERLRERYGRTEIPRPQGPLVWVHCASVGELLTVVPLMGCIREKGFAVLCTSGTVTSANIAAARLPAGTIHQFVTLDAPSFVNRFFNHWRPDLGLFVESDLWPNLVMTAARRRIPLILLNGRLSERSFQRWRWAPHSIAKLLRSFELCLAQSGTHAGRYRDLGAPRVATTGNLKLDVPEPPAEAHALARLRAAVAGRAVVAGASTHPGEETALLEVHRRLRHSFPGLLTIVAPRHPERGRDVLEMARQADLRPRMRSRGDLPDGQTDIYVLDTIGELGLVYRVAPIVFMGGSLASHGGQNPIEPAKLGAAILHGPNVWNFAEIYSALDRAHGAEQVTEVGKLAVRVGAWLTQRSEREAVAAAARSTVENLGGALARTLAAIEPYLMQIHLGMLEPHA